MTNSGAVAYVNRWLDDHDLTPATITPEQAQSLADLMASSAISKYGSKDNVTVMVVFFK